MTFESPTEMWFKGDSFLEMEKNGSSDLAPLASSVPVGSSPAQSPTSAFAAAPFPFVPLLYSRSGSEAGQGLLLKGRSHF